MEWNYIESGDGNVLYNTSTVFLDRVFMLAPFLLQREWLGKDII